MKVLDNKNRRIKINVLGDDYIIDKSDILPGTNYIEITDERFDCTIGDTGYYVVADSNSRGSYLCRFTAHNDCETVLKQNLMPIFGIKQKRFCALGIVKTLSQSFYVVISVKDGKYHLKLRFEITDFGINENIIFSLHMLEQSDTYIEMAKKYREYQLKSGMCIPLKERVKNNEYLRYAVESPEIRVRLAWKPAPPKILEQDSENEPDMHIACTFERVKDLIDELKRQGVDKAQICLVGWNKSGHDGRYPQLFPVEEKLGGEAKLRELIG